MQRKNDYHYVYVMPDLVRELAGTRDRYFSHYYAEVSGFRQIRLHWDFCICHSESSKFVFGKTDKVDPDMTMRCSVLYKIDVLVEMQN
jgi:hypothetical protein